jgi:hypothetical protein
LCLLLILIKYEWDTNNCIIYDRAWFLNCTNMNGYGLYAEVIYECVWIFSSYSSPQYPTMPRVPPPCFMTKNYIPFNSVFFSTVKMKYIIVNPIIKTCLSRMESITNSANIFFVTPRRDGYHIWNSGYPGTLDITWSRCIEHDL